MLSSKLFLPLRNVTAPASAYSIVGGFHDALSDGTHRRSTILRVGGVIAQPERGRPVVIWSGWLLFRATNPIAASFDPLSPGFSLAGDLVLTLWPSSLPSDDPLAPSQDIFVYRHLVVTSDWLQDVLTPLLNAEHAVLDQNGQPITTTVDQIRAFVRGEIRVFARSGNEAPILLPRLEPAGSDDFVELEMVCGLIAGSTDALSQAQADPLSHPGFSPYPLEFFFQIVSSVDHRHVFSDANNILGGELDHGLNAVFQAAPASGVITVIEELYAPDEGIIVEACYPTGLPDLTWTNYQYRWTDSQGTERRAPLPASGQFYFAPSSEPMSGGTSIFIEQQSNQAWIPRNAFLLAAGEMTPAAFAGPATSPSIVAGAGGALVLQQAAEAPYRKDWIRRWILHHREVYNQNNVTRVDHYLRYWLRNLEVTWPLMSTIVARNVGYQMSDIRRYYVYWTQTPTSFIDTVTRLPFKEAFRLLTEGHLLAFFTLLETINFLIFRDGYPQLAAYEWAKRLHLHTGADHSGELFDLLRERRAFDLDPLTVEEWKTFFAAAIRANWWPAPASGMGPEESRRARLAIMIRDPAIVRLYRAQIANEQNMFENRVVNDSARKYLGVFDTTSKEALDLMKDLELTVLVATPATSIVNPTVQHLLLYTVGDFTSLDDRITTAAELFANVLLVNDLRRDLIVTWTVQNPSHHGTRTDYNPADYSTDRSAALFPGGATYSPPLVPWNGQQEAWPVSPGLDAAFRHTHSDPIELPHWSTEHPQSRIDRWLSPPGAPNQAFRESPLQARAEIVI